MLTKKQTAINEACTAFDNLCKYKGITGDADTELYISKSATIAQIKHIAERLKNELSIPLQPATEKQINYLLVLSKDYKSEQEQIKKAKLNKFQASKLITLYKYTNDIIYHDAVPFCYAEGILTDIDKDIQYILSCVTL